MRFEALTMTRGRLLRQTLQCSGSGFATVTVAALRGLFTRLPCLALAYSIVNWCDYAAMYRYSNKYNASEAQHGACFLQIAQKRMPLDIRPSVLSSAGARESE